MLGTEHGMTSLASALTRSKHQTTHLIQYLMDELFTEDRGKKSLYPPLDQDTMNANNYIYIAIS